MDKRVYRKTDVRRRRKAYEPDRHLPNGGQLQSLPSPDGTIIAALHYRHVPSDENNTVFGRDQSFVAGPPTNIQFMVKDSKRYAATGGWGFGHFQDGKPSADEAMMKTCFTCHQQMKARDLVFTRYAP